MSEEDIKGRIKAFITGRQAIKISSEIYALMSDEENTNDLI